MSRTPSAPTLVMVPFREVRHDRPDDCIHHELLSVRGQEYGGSIPDHRHEDLHQLQWLARGRVALRIDGEQRTVTAPALIHVAPGCVHGFDYDDDSEGEQVTVPAALLRSTLADAPQLLEWLGRSFVAEVAATHADVHGLHARMAGVRDEFNAQHPGRTQALQAWTSLLFVLAARWAEQGGGRALQGRRTVVRDVLLRRFRGLVERHFAEPLALKDYAARLGVTVDHLSRVCRASTGQHALEVLHERRVREARRLLAHTRASVASIAAATGHADPAYFSRFFARVTGMSPLAYRQAAQSGKRA